MYTVHMQDNQPAIHISKVYGFQTVHPLLGMNDGDVSEALSRLTVYKNVIKKDSPLKDVLDDLSDREQLLRVWNFSGHQERYAG